MHGYLNPGEIKSYEIELENLGNAKTTVTAEAFNIPEGWTVSILDSTVLGTLTKNEDNKKTLTLSIRSSDDFGYRNSVEIINISWISNNYNGNDLQEEIRNFLIDKYKEWDIDYVLIVGTRNTIPMRRCDPIIWDYGEYLYSDFYYSDFFINSDNDSTRISFFH